MSPCLGKERLRGFGVIKGIYCMNAVQDKKSLNY